MELGRAKNIIGNRYGHWTVIERAENSKDGKTRWLCRCDCGTIRSVDNGHLKSGASTNCGCEAFKKTSERNRVRKRTHGGTSGEKQERLYDVHRSMKRRCYEPSNNSYHNYGGRGIKVCDEWLGEHGYENFRKWAMENGYDPNAERQECTLDRIDNNGNYCPENCRWVNAKIQGNNRNDNHILEYQGERHTVVEWAEKMGMLPVTLYARIRRGWPIEKALKTPIDGTRRNKRAVAFSL